MASINQFTVLGNLTKDVQVRTTAGGVKTAQFTVAMNEVFTDKNGKKQESVTFLPVTVFGKQGENAATYLKKGEMVAVEGRMASWYNAETKKGGVNFIAERVQYLSKNTNAKAANVDGQWGDDYHAEQA